MKTIKLNQLKNMARIIAEKEIELNGEYFCFIAGKIMNNKLKLAWDCCKESE